MAEAYAVRAMNRARAALAFAGALVAACSGGAPDKVQAEADTVVGVSYRCRLTTGEAGQLLFETEESCRRLASEFSFVGQARIPVFDGVIIVTVRTPAGEIYTSEITLKGSELTTTPAPSLGSGWPP